MRCRPPAQNPAPYTSSAPAGRQTLSPPVHLALCFAPGHPISNREDFAGFLPSSRKASHFAECLEPLVRSFAMFIFQINMPQAETPSLPLFPHGMTAESKAKGGGRKPSSPTGCWLCGETCQELVPGFPVPPAQTNTSLRSLPSQAVGKVPPFPHPSPAASIPARLDPAPVPSTACRPGSIFSHGRGSSPWAHLAEIFQLWMALPPPFSALQISLILFSSPGAGLLPFHALTRVSKGLTHLQSTEDISPSAIKNQIFFTESQNHRMLGVGRDLCGSSSPTLLPKQGHLQQAAQDLVQPFEA